MEDIALYKLSSISTLSPFVVNLDYTYNDVTENKMESDRYFAILSQQNYQRYQYCQR
jgi:hypothetical protein